MSNSASTAASWQAAVEAEFDRRYALDQQKKNKEFEESIKKEVAKLPPNPLTGPPTRFSEGGATKKRTTRTKKMKRRHTRKPRRSKHSLKLKHQYKK
jgi:hypothetical protein